jgi:hypothetical protein
MEARSHGFSHQLFAADAGKLGELADAFRTVVRVFEFGPLLRFHARHLPDWHRRRAERTVAPPLSEQEEVVARTQRLLARLQAGGGEGLHAPVATGTVRLARWQYVQRTIERLERLVDLGASALLVEDFVRGLVDTLRAIGTEQPPGAFEAEPLPESLEYDDQHPIQLADAVQDCVALCIDPWPENLGLGLAFDGEPEAQQAWREARESYEEGTPTFWETTHNPQPRCARHHYQLPSLWRPPGLLPDRLLVDSADLPLADFLDRYPKPIPSGEAGGEVCIAMPAEVQRFTTEIDGRRSASPATAASLATMKERCAMAAGRGHAIVGWIEYAERGRR